MRTPGTAGYRYPAGYDHPYYRILSRKPEMTLKNSAHRVVFVIKVPRVPGRNAGRTVYLSAADQKADARLAGLRRSRESFSSFSGLPQMFRNAPSVTMSRKNRSSSSSSLSDPRSFSAAQ